MSFWKFSACSKLDILTENDYNYNDIIISMLNDPETRFEIQSYNDFIAYGNGDEALLVQTRTATLRIIIYLYYSILKMFK